MRNVPAGMQAKLDEGATTFCACWRIDPINAPALGFTDHDRNLFFGGVAFEAASGFETTSIERSLGLSIDNGAAKGALRSEKISEVDIRKGVYDAAEVRQWIVDWSDPANRILNFRGEIGEIRRGELAFEVELRGLAEKLNRPTGRHYLSTCDAVLGDARCGVDLTGSEFRGLGVVSSVLDVRTFIASGLAAFEAQWFADGKLTWSGGANSGLDFGVRSQRPVVGGMEIEVDRDFVETPEAGDGFAAFAGCDKRFATCRGKFSNGANFRGFPFIPGDTWMAAYPVEGGVHDGGRRRGS